MTLSISQEQTHTIVRHAVERERGIARASEKLSSASRINRAADDAAGLAVSERMRARYRGLDQATRNIQDGISMLQVADGGLATTQEMIQRLRTLAIQASNDTLTTADRRLIQLEVDQLASEIDRTSSAVQFNGRKLVGPIPKGADPADVIFLIDTSGSMAAEIGNVIAGLNNLTNGLAAAGIQARYAVYDVNDVRYAGPDNGIDLALDFTGDTTQVANALAGLLPVTGSPVRNWDALQAALPGGADVGTLGASPPTLRFIIQLTDTSGNEGGTVTSEAAQAANLVAQDAVYFGVVTPAFNNQYDDIANATGGQLFDIAAADYTPLLNSITSEIIATAVGTVLGPPVVLQVGSESRDSYTLSFPVETTAEALGLDNLDVTTRSGIDAAIAAADSALNLVAGYRAVLGSEQNRLSSMMNFTRVESEQAKSSESKIRDAEMGELIADLARETMMAEGARAAMAQSGLEAQAVLRLLG